MMHYFFFVVLFFGTFFGYDTSWLKNNFFLSNQILSVYLQLKTK